jgi:hypothetical protein
VLSSEASDIPGNFPEIPDFPKIPKKMSGISGTFESNG